MVKERQNHKIRNLRAYIIEGAPSSTGPPPTPPTFQVLPEAQLGSEASDSGEICQEDSGEASQALAGACRRQVDSEGSLSLMGWLTLAPRGARGAEREGESMSAQTRAVREGRGVTIKGGVGEGMNT